MNIVPFEDNVTYDDDGSCTYSAWYSEFRTKKYYSWAPGLLISFKVFTVFDLDLSLAFAVYPSGNVTHSKDHVSVYLHNCNEEAVYVHATLDFLGEKHDIRQCIASGAVGFISPGIVINEDDNRGSSHDSFDGLSCKFHQIMKHEDVWDKYNETIPTNKLQPLTSISPTYQTLSTPTVPPPPLPQNWSSMTHPPSFLPQTVQSQASTTLQKKGELETRIMMLENEVLEMKKQNQRKMEIEKESNKSKFKHLQMDFDKLQGNFNRMQSKLKNIEAKLVTELQKIEQIQDNIDMKLEFFISLGMHSKKKKLLRRRHWSIWEGGG